MRRVITFLRRIYRLSLNRSKQEALVLKDLEKLHTKAEWRFGLYKSEKYLETIFSLSENKLESFFYQVTDGYFHCRVKVLEDFPVELTTEIFILAAHFNNLLKNGVVKINTNNQYVEYTQKFDVFLPLLYKDLIYHLMMSHYDTSKDVYWAFQRLINENEAPAIIIADLLKKIEEEEQKDKTTT